MSPRVFVSLGVAGVALGVSGCTRTEPHLTPVVATSDQAMASWRSRVDGRFTLDEWREFDAMIQEVRLRVRSEGEATGHDPIEDAMHRRVHGRTFRDVLKLGYESRLQRLEQDRIAMQQVLHTNSWLVTKPGDRESPRYLEGLRQRQQQRLDSILAEMETANQRLIALGGKWQPAVVAAVESPATPFPLKREDGRREIAAMIGEIRGAALMKFGAWPLSIDRDGARLPDDERAAFMRQRAAAEAEGRKMVPVRLKGRWWIYEGTA